MKKQFILSLFLVPIAINAQKNKKFIFPDSIEVVDDECEDDFFVDFDTLLSSEYDPDNPEELKLPSKNPIEYVPPIVRTIGFALFTSYIELHNAVKKRFKRIKKYLLAKLCHKQEGLLSSELEDE